MAKCKETLAITNHRVISEDINEHETVYGGRILEILDGTASTSAARLALARIRSKSSPKSSASIF